VIAPRLAEDLLRPLKKIGRVYLGGLDVARYAQLVPQADLDPNVGQQPSTTTNALLRRLTPDSARALLKVIGHRSQPFVQVRAIGGAVNDVDRAATAYAHRDAQVLVTVSIFPPYTGNDLDDEARPLWPHAVGAYRNFESRPSEESFTRAFPGATGERVRLLAARYDPDGVLRRVDRV